MSEVLSLKNLTLVRDGKNILEDINWSVSADQRWVIVGPNGAGKTTFLKMITGLLDPDQGKVTAGQTTAFGYYRQEEDRFDEEKRLIDVVKDIAEVVVLDKGQTITVSQFLTQFGFPPKQQFTPIGKMSGGERRRLQLLLVLIKNPNFLILDEPTNDLDLMTLNILEEFLDTFPGCLIIVSHDRYFMDKIVDHLFVFRGQGEIENFPGNYSDFRAYEDSVDVAQKEIASNLATTAKNDWKQNNPTGNLTFNEQKEFQKIERDIKDLEIEKAKIEQLFTDGKVEENAIEKKANELKNIINKIESKEERWFELSSKMEG